MDIFLQIISNFTAVAFFLWVGTKFLDTQLFFCTALFLTWQFSLKILGTLFLDNFGPIYSDEVFTEVGGSGFSTPIMVLFCFIPLYFISNATKSFPPITASKKHITIESFYSLSDMSVFLFFIYIFLLYYDLFRAGNIPFLAGIDRFQYQGSVFHQFLENFVFLIAYYIGYMLAYTRIYSGYYDHRFLLIIFSLFIYLFLTGHRFGSFYVFTCFSLLPLGSVGIAAHYNHLVFVKSDQNIIYRFLNSRFLIYLFCFSALILVLYAMYNSLIYVRDGDPVEALVQRFFVKPIHMYWLAWNELDLFNLNSQAYGWDFILNNPFDPNRNTSIQYLMSRYLGSLEAYRIYMISGVDYAGGYPEILFDLLGFWGGLLFTLIFSYFTSILYRISVSAVYQGKLISGMMSTYVSFGLLQFYLGGMINFLFPIIFWIKVCILLFVINLEDRYKFTWVILKK